MVVPLWTPPLNQVLFPAFWVRTGVPKVNKFLLPVKALWSANTSAATVQLSVPVIAALGGIVFLGYLRVCPGSSVQLGFFLRQYFNLSSRCSCLSAVSSPIAPNNSLHSET